MVKWCAPMLVSLTALLVINGAHAGPDLVGGGGGGCNCTLLVQPTPTYADVGLDLQLALVVLFFPSTSANTLLALLQLVLCGDGCVWWYIIQDTHI